MLHTSQLLALMRAENAQGERPRVNITYRKNDGELATFLEARLIKYTPSNETILVSVPGGNRRLRLYTIIACNGQEVYL